MAQKRESDGVILSEADRRRLESDRLEIATRLAGLARTLATTFGLDQGHPDQVVISTTQARRGSGETVDIEIPWIEVRWPDGTVICYQDPPGVCCRKPCPCQ